MDLAWNSETEWAFNPVDYWAPGHPTSSQLPNDLSFESSLKKQTLVQKEMNAA